MKNKNFYILDVFAEKKYSGNQLAVFPEANEFPDSEMQQIAKEINFSETSFILSNQQHNNGYDIRIFTPQKEVPFAGHPTIGAAYIIQKMIIKKNVPETKLNLKIGQITISYSYSEGEIDKIFMNQPEPSFGNLLDAKQTSQVLRIEKVEIDTRFPIEEVSTGLPFIIVPLKTLDTLKNIKIDKDKYFDFIKKQNAKAILAFSPETYNKENDLNVRVFGDYFGIPEDPATGSANGALGGFLIKHNYFRNNHLKIRIEQGYEIGRPSLILLEANKETDKTIISIGGNVILIAKGVFV